MNKSALKFSTRAIHAGLDNDAFGSPHMPLYDTTTFKYADTEKMERVIDGRDSGYFYTRYGSNPGIVNIERKLASLEQAEAALVFASGMAAISATLVAHGGRGIVCMGELYGGSWELMTEQLASLVAKWFLSKPATRMDCSAICSRATAWSISRRRPTPCCR